MDVAKILAEAWAAPYTPERASGCGRVYIALFGNDRKTMAAIRKAAKAQRILFYSKSQGGSRLGNTLYVGYDNARGDVLGRGTAIAAALKAAGISCYREEYED